MPNSLLVSIGVDAQRPGKFYWDIKGAFSREVIVDRRDFDSFDAAKIDLEEFKQNLLTADVIENRLTIPRD